MTVAQTPRFVDIGITSRCNLRCRYCSHFSSASDGRPDLPTAEWLAFFRKLKESAVLRVTLGGGEPFMRPDLKELLDGIVGSRMRFRILSNGALISAGMASFIASTARCDYVQVSLDGPDTATHDVCRGDGSFTGAMRAIGLLEQAGVRVAVRVTIHRHNLHALAKLARLLLEELELPRFTTNYASLLGMCRANKSELLLSPQERSVAMQILSDLNEKYDGRIGGSAGPVAEAKMWGEMMRARSAGKRSLPGRGTLKGCNSVFHSLAVRADGVMIPCAQMSHLELGRVDRDDLGIVWREHPQLVRLRTRRSIPLEEFAFCDGCGFRSFCTGNCPALSYTAVGIEDHPCPDACLRQFLDQGGRLPRQEVES